MKLPETTWSSAASWMVEKPNVVVPGCGHRFRLIVIQSRSDATPIFWKCRTISEVKKLVETGWFYIVLDVKLVSNTQSPEKFYPSFKLSKIQVFVKWCRCNDFNEKQRIIWNFVSEYLSKLLFTFLERSSDRTFLSNLLHQQMLRTMKYMVLLAYW